MRHLVLPLLLASAVFAPAQQSTPQIMQQTQTTLPDAPSAVLSGPAIPETEVASSSDHQDRLTELYSYSLLPQQDATAAQARQSDKPKPKSSAADQVDSQGNPIPLDRQQPKRILGFMPNFRTVAAGSKPPTPTWRGNFKIATHQAFDYSSFLFLGLTSISAEGINSHPALRKGVHGFYSYTWRGFLDKTDGTYLSAFVLASALREDTRYYPLGSGHNVFVRGLYVISRQAVARDYTGHNVFNGAGLGGKVLTQYISRSYYPAGSSDLSVLATKFAYSAMRDIAFSSIREFYPDIAAHYIRKHREKMARLAEQSGQASAPKP